jgi:integrase/recombinase XerD
MGVRCPFDAPLAAKRVIVVPAPHPVPGDPTDPDGFPVLVANFCEWLAVRGYSPTTVARYHVSLALFADWAVERGVEAPREVTRPIIERYQRSLFHHRQPSGKPLTFRSQTARLVALRALYRWLARSHRVLVNPTAELELPRVPRWQPRSAMTVPEVEDVLARPDLNTVDGLRDRAILETFYSTAVRASELAMLNIFDLDVARGTLAVNAGKGGRSRVVPISDRAVGWCEKYLLDSRPQLAVPPDERRLFLANRGGPIPVKRLTAIARKYLDAAGIKKPGSCHLFRHTAATLMLEGGADIRFIQQLLGHAELSTTQLYTHVSIGALKAVHERCHPGAGNRPPRTPWPPQEHAQLPSLGLDGGLDDEEGGIDGWDRQAASLLAELGDDEPDT